MASKIKKREKGYEGSFGARSRSDATAEEMKEARQEKRREGEEDDTASAGCRWLVGLAAGWLAGWLAAGWLLVS